MLNGGPKLLSRVCDPFYSNWNYYHVCTSGVIVSITKMILLKVSEDLRNKGRERSGAFALMSVPGSTLGDVKLVGALAPVGGR